MTESRPNTPNQTPSIQESPQIQRTPKLGETGAKTTTAMPFKKRFSLKMIAAIGALLLLIIGGAVAMYLQYQEQDNRQQAYEAEDATSGTKRVTCFEMNTCPHKQQTFTGRLTCPSGYTLNAPNCATTQGPLVAPITYKKCYGYNNDLKRCTDATVSTANPCSGIFPYSDEGACNAAHPAPVSYTCWSYNSLQKDCVSSTSTTPCNGTTTFTGKPACDDEKPAPVASGDTTAVNTVCYSPLYCNNGDSYTTGPTVACLTNYTKTKPSCTPATNSCKSLNESVTSGETCCLGLTPQSGICKLYSPPPAANTGNTTTACAPAGQAPSGTQECCSGSTLNSQSGVCESKTGSTCIANGNYAGTGQTCCPGTIRSSSGICTTTGTKTCWSNVQQIAGTGMFNSCTTTTVNNITVCPSTHPNLSQPSGCTVVNPAPIASGTTTTSTKTCWNEDCQSVSGVPNNQLCSANAGYPLESKPTQCALPTKSCWNNNCQNIIVPTSQVCSGSYPNALKPTNCTAATPNTSLTTCYGIIDGQCSTIRVSSCGGTHPYPNEGACATALFQQTSTTCATINQYASTGRPCCDGLIRNSSTGICIASNPLSSTPAPRTCWNSQCQSTTVNSESCPSSYPLTARPSVTSCPLQSGPPITSGDGPLASHSPGDRPTSSGGTVISNPINNNTGGTCSGALQSCESQGCCAGLMCQGVSGSRVCQDGPDDVCGSGATCGGNQGWLGFQCGNLSNGQCLENPQTFNSYQEAYAYASAKGCGQVDEVCVGGSMNRQLCGGFNIINTTCGTPQTPPGPTNPPGPGGTPAPTPGPVCLNVAASKRTDIRVGDQITFTCGTVAGVSKYEFRVRLPNGTIQTVNASSATPNMSENFTISTLGDHKAQCRICPGTTPTCQEWEAM